jgi:hypothetical protein
LAVFFFAFFAFLAMLPSVIPKVGSMQVDIRHATAKAFGLAWDANPAGGSR